MPEATRVFADFHAYVDAAHAGRLAIGDRVEVEFPPARGRFAGLTVSPGGGWVLDTDYDRDPDPEPVSAALREAA